MTKYRVTPDSENNAETWWQQMDEQHPRLANHLRRAGSLVVDADLLATLRTMPGYSDGPEYARDALVVEEVEA